MAVHVLLLMFSLHLHLLRCTYSPVDSFNRFTLQIGDRNCECGCGISWDTDHSNLSSSHQKQLTVWFREIIPFAYKDARKNKTSGLLVDLWSMVAEFNGWNYTPYTVQETSNSIIEHFTKDPNVDVLLGDFTLTWNRLTRYNISFTTPFVSKELLLMRKKPMSMNDGWWIVKSFTEWCWAVFFLFVAMSAFVIWICEHWDNLSLSYMYKYFCCCKSVHDIMHTIDSNTQKADNTADVPLQDARSKSRSVGDIEMYKKAKAGDHVDGETVYNQITIVPTNAEAFESKKPKLMPVMGNTLALFWFGGMFPHVKTASAKFLISFLKLWVLVMSSFYLSNLTALRTAEITQPTKVQSTQDMWLPDARICGKANSFIEEFLYEDLGLPNVITCDKQLDCVEMLLNDECDGFVSSSHWIKYVSHLHCNLEVVGDLVRPEFAGWIVKPKSEYLSGINNALIKLKSEGVVDKLFKKYVDIPTAKCNDNEEGIVGKFSGNENQVDVEELEIMWVCIGFAWILTLLIQCYRAKKS